MIKGRDFLRKLGKVERIVPGTRRGTQRNTVSRQNETTHVEVYKLQNKNICKILYNQYTHPVRYNY